MDHCPITERTTAPASFTTNKKKISFQDLPTQEGVCSSPLFRMTVETWSATKQDPEGSNDASCH
jgi:hypothetical protein